MTLNTLLRKRLDPTQSAQTLSLDVFKVLPTFFNIGGGLEYSLAGDGLLGYQIGFLWLETALVLELERHGRPRLFETPVLQHQLRFPIRRSGRFPTPQARNMNDKPTLYIVGMPLDESSEISNGAATCLSEASLIVGESRKMTMRYLKNIPGVAEKEILLSRSYRKEEMSRLKDSLSLLQKSGGVAASSDTGMPILFDPGQEVLDLCRAKAFTIRSVAGPTSWGMASALSGFSPPFELVGFLPRENELRLKALTLLRSLAAHSVLMDTPYRFKLLLSQSREIFGPTREAFLAWEIAKAEEQLIWGTLESIGKVAANVN